MLGEAVVMVISGGDVGVAGLLGGDFIPQHFTDLPGSFSLTLIVSSLRIRSVWIACGVLMRAHMKDWPIFILTSNLGEKKLIRLKDKEKVFFI